MRILVTVLIFISFCLNAKSPDKEPSLENLLKGSKPFFCHVGRFEIIKFSHVGAFNKFSLKGSGSLINPSGIAKNIVANEDIEYMVPSSDKYMAKGKYISILCSKSLSTGGNPFPIEFYVEAK